MLYGALVMIGSRCVIYIFFFNDTATTEIYTLSLHDALPISIVIGQAPVAVRAEALEAPLRPLLEGASPICSSLDRKSTRLNSSHANISYAVFCLKKKKQHTPARIVPVIFRSAGQYRRRPTLP